MFVLFFGYNHNYIAKLHLCISILPCVSRIISTGISSTIDQNISHLGGKRALKYNRPATNASSRYIKLHKSVYVSTIPIRRFSKQQKSTFPLIICCDWFHKLESNSLRITDAKIYNIYKPSGDRINISAAVTDSLLFI